MKDQINDFIKFIQAAQVDSKEELIKKVTEKFTLYQNGPALYWCDDFAVRFCYSKCGCNRKGSFPNTVIGISKLYLYDHIPVFVVLVSKGKPNVIYLINSTFIKKVSQSSKKLEINNLRGSINGSDLELTPYNIPNEPDNFDKLFGFHVALDWDENIERIVENTKNPQRSLLPPFQPDSDATKNILNAPDRASAFTKSLNYIELLKDLNGRCQSMKDAIFAASHNPNNNIRGRLIEILITEDEDRRIELLRQLKNQELTIPTYRSKNGLGDYHREFANPKDDTYTDIKTKIMYKESCPKMFNIDKFLECMSKDNSVFLFFFIGIDDKGNIQTQLVSTFHKDLIENMKYQSHWSGKNRRGTTQLDGQVIENILSNADFKNEINIEKSCDKLREMIKLK